tara:strand:- start:4399 stop:4632 length:234 start_codon:yes stop_codon:yes gene_type:complete
MLLFNNSSFALGGNTRRDETMAETENNDTKDDEDERIPVMQSILDNPFLLLFIGVAVPSVFYTIWGIMEIAAIPIAN